jgi:hypothetical protein
MQQGATFSSPHHAKERFISKHAEAAVKLMAARFRALGKSAGSR